MAYCSYSLEQKIRFLDAYEEFGSIATAAQKVDVPENTSRYWIIKENQLREAYKRSQTTRDSPSNSPRGSNAKLSLEEKIACIQEHERGDSIREIAHQHSCGKSAVLQWYKRRDELLALYYSQNTAQEVDSYLNNLAATVSGAGEDELPKDELTKDLSKKIKKQAKEIEFLKDKITFLENLNEILQKRSGPVKKKNCSRQSNKVSHQGEET